MESEMDMGDTPATDAVQRYTVSRGGESHSASFYAKQLMSPEWMVDVPTGITTDWYVVPHPEGERCLVISSRGGTVSRRRNGSIVHRFPSALPNGSRATGANSDSYCILDCVFHKTDQTYYVLDIMCWKGHAVYDCTAEFRLFWVQCKLQETDAGCPPAAQHRYRFCPLPAYATRSLPGNVVCRISSVRCEYLCGHGGNMRRQLAVEAWSRVSEYL
eukprot:gene28018-34651_t